MKNSCLLLLVNNFLVKDFLFSYDSETTVYFLSPHPRVWLIDGQTQSSMKEESLECYFDSSVRNIKKIKGTSDASVITEASWFLDNDWDPHSLWQIMMMKQKVQDNQDRQIFFALQEKITCEVTRYFACNKNQTTIVWKKDPRHHLSIIGQERRTDIIWEVVFKKQSYNFWKNRSPDVTLCMWNSFSE